MYEACPSENFLNPFIIWEVEFGACNESFIMRGDTTQFRIMLYCWDNFKMWKIS